MAKAGVKLSDLKLIECDRFLKVKGERVKCPGQWLGKDKRCPKWDEHLHKFPTGHCQIGSHEGIKNLSHSGKVMKPCEMFVTCPCKCHADLDKLFAMSDKERIYVDVSGYQPEPSPFIGPREDPDYYFSNRDTVDSPRTDEDGPRTAAAPSGGPAYQPTPTGRAARGELESWVHDAFMIWLVEQDGAFTPTYVAKEIARKEGIESSVGAIDAVFKRWAKLGFVMLAKKPTRLVAISPEGKELGLDKMKRKAKREHQMAMAAARRGSLR